MLARLFSLLTLLLAAPLAHAGGAVVHPKIDVAGQRALGAWLDDGADRALNAVALVALINAGGLDGVYLDNQGVPAQRARRLGLSWWTIVPEGQLGVVLMPSRPGEAPILVLKNKVATNPEARAEALGQAWVAGATVALGGTMPCEEGGLAPLQGSVPQQCLAVETVPRSEAAGSYALTAASTNASLPAYPGFALPFRRAACLHAGAYLSFHDCVKAIGKRKGYPALQPASAHGGVTYTGGPLTEAQLLAIMGEDLAELEGSPKKAAAEDRLRTYRPHIDRAFDLMLADTIQSRAWLLGHFSGEDGGGVGVYQLEEQGAGEAAYAPFWGRGMMHITLQVNFVRALAYVDGRQLQVEREFELGRRKLVADIEAALPNLTWTRISALEEQAARLNALVLEANELRQTVRAVASKLENASDPRYSFILSGGYMQGTCGRTCCMDDIGTLGPVESFAPGTSTAAACVSGGASSRSGVNRATLKAAAYRRAFKVLSCRNTSANPDSCMP